MQDSIRKALEKQFEQHRIVVWKDSDREFVESFESFDIPDVVAIEVQNNEFGLKYRILREQPDVRFLLYRPGPVPQDRDNWLLDVELAYSVFVADQASIWLYEIGLSLDHRKLVKAHEAFFAAAKRRKALKQLLTDGDSSEKLKLKMTAVCCDSDAQLDAVLEALLAEFASEKDGKYNLLLRCKLTDFLWKKVRHDYGYKSESPSVKDFAISLFHSAYVTSLGETGTLDTAAIVLLNRWKNNRNYLNDFQVLSGQVSDWLNVVQSLENRDYKHIGAVDYFEEIDKYVLQGLVSDVEQKTISVADCFAIVDSRRASVWFEKYESAYFCVKHACYMLNLVAQMNYQSTSLTEAFEQYVKHAYFVDFNYRKFVFFLRKSGMVSLFSELRDTIEKIYVNQFLPGINDCWQGLLNGLDQWKIKSVVSQAAFFKDFVAPVLRKDQKVVVVVSDALRFEVASELCGRIQEEDRFEPDLQALLGSLPSYTQLGMAALLPHESLEIKPDKQLVVFVDGKPSAGIENRKKILEEWNGKRGTAIDWSELMGMDREASRELVRTHDFIYVFHNQIDAVGDKRDSEERLCEAVEQAQDEVIRILKKLANANVTNMIITADHGFLYQYTDVEESDYAIGVMAGAQIHEQKRRYVIGGGLQANNSFLIFDAKQLGLGGDNVQVAIPKSVNRLRRKGSGSRFVHGGAALQEVVVPVLQVRKKRQSDVSYVDVEILGGPSQYITTNQLTITLYQREPVRDKTLGRVLRVGLYAQDGTLLSDQKEIQFNVSNDLAASREKKVTLLLDRSARNYKRQSVFLRLEEKITGTTKYRHYKHKEYELRQSIESDFD